MSVFHAYDIRGLWPGEITPEFAFNIGWHFARWSKARTVFVAHDARLHSAELSVKLVDGLSAAGCAVTDLGLASTPQMHYYQMRDRCDAGIMVTASHNPKNYHGFKFYDRVGGSISYDKGLDRIEALMKNRAPVSPRSGTVTENARLDEYVEFIAGQARGARFTRRLVIDAANGSAGPVVSAVAKRLGLSAMLINTEPDGNFPNHDPNPLKDESRLQAAAAVKSAKADAGVILDGDGDRIIFLDEKGDAIENYFMSALIAEQLLKSAPGAAVVYDLISSRVLPERIEALGGKAVVSRVGYTYLYDRMVEAGAVFGAETSGHVYFKVSDSYYTESAVYAMVVALSLLEKAGRPLSEILAPLRSRYFQPRELNIRAADKDRALALVKERFKDGKLSELDGVSVAYDDVWFNIRPSNTEPLIRVRLEGRSEAIAKRTIAEIEKTLEGA
jgi:phosphomannomutase